MNTTIVLWLGGVALLAILLKEVFRFFYKGQKEKIEDEKPSFDFKVEAFHPSKGWFGVIFDEGFPKYTHVSLPESISLKKGDTLRVKLLGYEGGNYVAEAIDLSSLPQNTIVPTYKTKDGLWHCMYAGPKGIAFVGYILKHELMDTPVFKAGVPYRAIRHDESYFSLA
ncbi:MAG: hypothetical protein IJ529_05515 [Alphaproteobacteria bacterium]|nr:hypothetical protein [Alphaproteobacteria bacterium]MBQ8677907.1 hypothetical protein [Alphaproteobacteria bacterium]